MITDDACRDIADALVHEIEAVGARYASFVLEDDGAAAARRPARPRSPRTWNSSDVSIFAARAQANELGSRMEMTDIVNRRRMRHAHMVNITPQIMREGMRADFRAVDRISQR